MCASASARVGGGDMEFSTSIALQQRIAYVVCVCNVCNVRVYQGTSARAGAALINQILVLPVGQGQNLKG